MSSIDDPSSGKAEEQAPGKTSGSPRDTSSASSYRSAKEEHQAHERLEYLKQDIKTLKNSLLSRSIKIGKLKGAESKDGELIEQLEKENKLIKEMVDGDEKAVKKLGEEVEKERKEKNKQVIDLGDNALTIDAKINQAP
ncbi:MAG: hypothetical protein Q9161_008234 [Pseudevernia consocians]